MPLPYESSPAAVLFLILAACVIYGIASGKEK